MSDMSDPPDHSKLVAAVLQLEQHPLQLEHFYFKLFCLSLTLTTVKFEVLHQLKQCNASGFILKELFGVYGIANIASIYKSLQQLYFCRGQCRGQPRNPRKK